MRNDSSTPTADDPLEQARELVPAALRRYSAGHLEEAVAICDRALALTGHRDAPLRREIEAVRAMAALLGGGPEGVTDVLRRAQDPGAGEPAPGERAELAQLAIARMAAVAGSAADAVAIAERALGDGALLAEETAAGLNVFALVGVFYAADELARGDEVASELLAEAQRRGSAPAIALARYVRAWPRMLLGRLDDAVADLRFALAAAPGGWEAHAGYARSLLACCLVERDELDEAEAVAWAVPDDELPPMAMAVTLRARAVVRAAQGRVAQARDLALHSGRLEAVRNPGIAPWRSTAAELHVALGERDEALALVEDELDLARAWGAPRPLGTALRAAGIAAGGERGLALLREATTLLARSEAKLEHTRALGDLGTALCRAGRPAEARGPLTRALELAEQMGAARIAAHARAQLPATGARPRRPAKGGIEALTPAERRVAAMAADGLTNREIAAELVVTAKAVEKHLSSVYAKLGITSRQSLPDALALH